MYSDETIDGVLREFKAGVSFNSIARSTGISRRSLSNWRAGHRPCRQPRGFREPVRPEDVVRWAPKEYSYLLGLYLGDGHLVEFQRDCWALRVACDAAYPLIVEEARSAMLACRRRGKASVRKVPDSNCLIVVSYSKAWPGLFPQHGRGRKHDRPIYLAPWQAELTKVYARELVRGLIHSDGCRFTAKQLMGTRVYEYDRYSFVNHSEDILRIVSQHLDLLGIEWTRSNWKTIQVARREAVARLDTFVGPKR